MKISVKLLGAFSVVFLAGCAAGRGDKKLADLEDSLSDLRQFQAEQTTEISSLRDELRKLTGRIDELQYQGARRIDPTPGFTPSYDPAPNVAAPRLETVPPGVPEAILVEDEGVLSTLPPPVAEPFQQGLRLIRAGSFGESTPYLKRAVDYNYDDKVLPRILFWLGLAEEYSGKLKDAVAIYHDISSRFPKSGRTPSVLLRLGGVFEKLKDRETAKLTYQKLVTQYPNSSAASIARKKLGGGGR